ncbi:hypothetical protein ACQ4PT_030419 [Festuca glaucescens]
MGPTWAGPSSGPVLRPFSARDDPPTASCEEVVGEPGPGAGGLPGGSSGPVGGPSPVHTNMWWWIRKGAHSAPLLGFPASSKDIRQRGATARIVRLAPPPPPLSRSFAQAVLMGSWGPSSHNGNGKRPAVKDARAEAAARASALANNNARQPAPGPGQGAAHATPPAWWVAREKKRDARRHAAEQQGTQAHAGGDRGGGRGADRRGGQRTGPPGPSGTPAAPVAAQRSLASAVPEVGGVGVLAGGAGISKAKCFKCGQVGHFQLACTNDQVCVFCARSGHYSADCPLQEKNQAPELLLMGQAIQDEGFFYLYFEDDEHDEVGASNAAIISFTEAALGAAELESELKHLVECVWDWKVTPLAPGDFSVVFPSQDTLRMSARSGHLFLPLCETMAKIRLAEANPAPVEKLQAGGHAYAGAPAGGGRGLSHG